VDAVPVGELPEQQTDRAQRVGEDDRAGRQHERARVPGGVAEALARARQPEPDLAADALGVEGRHGHPGLDDRDRQRVVHEAAAQEPARLHPLQRGLLGGGGAGVRVDADLAEEDPVGPRDGLLAQVDRLASGVAVAQLAEAIAHRRRAAAPGGGARARNLEPELGELLRQLGVGPAVLDPEVHQPPCFGAISAIAARRSASDWYPSAVSATSPPGSANTVVGQSPAR
jgi:hypothetical protein